MKVVLVILSLGLVGFATATAAPAPDATATAPAPRQDPISAGINRPIEPAGAGAAEAGVGLGEPFESLGLGIALRRPAGSKVIRQVGGTQVEFVVEPKKWDLKVARTALTQPMPLESSKGDDGVRKVGLLEVTVDKLKDDLPGAAILRNDVVRIGETDVGMIALRYVKGLETLLSQQAMIRASDRLYFTLTLTSPGSKAAGKEAGDDPAERQAVEAFGEVLDTIRLLDQRPLVRDQEDRLFASRALLVNLGAKDFIKNKLIPEQWFRLSRNGKDIGYVYTVEEVADGIPGDARGELRRKKVNRKAGPEGILVGTRSRSLVGDDLRSDAQSWMFVANDRHVEEWSTLQVVQNLKDSSQYDQATTVGSSSRQFGRRLDRKANEQGLRGEVNDPNQPPVREIDNYVLNVTHASKTETGEPLNQGVSDWYLPQALAHLLPRLLPVNRPNKFMFAVYVPDVRMVMERYLEVGEDKQVNFNGENVRVIPITDRIGLEGSVTTHYMSLDGKYLGSENPDSGVVVVPSNEATLTALWKDADLTRPADVKPKAAATGAPATPGRPAGPATPAATTGAGAGDINRGKTPRR